MNLLKKDWYEKHLTQIIIKAGARYNPELNVDLSISEIFDGISRTEKFYETIRQKNGELYRDFGYVSPKYEKEELQKDYDQLKKKIDTLFTLIGQIKSYDTDLIPWVKIQKLTKKLYDALWKFTDKLREENDRLKDLETSPKKDGSYRQSPSEKFNSNIHHIYKTQGLVQYFRELSFSTKAQLSNDPYLLLTGLAGRGKTHLLCDIAEHRIKNGKDIFPAILVFGEYYSNDKDFWFQTFEQLGIDKTIITKQSFLKQLDSLGKKANCRSLLMIDALNENIAQAPGFWKKNLTEIVNEIKKYPNISLIVSVRSGFENDVLTKQQNNLFIEEEHHGFRFREWEAIHKFFTAFSLPLPEIPLLMLEFQEPLFLLLFCKAFKKREKRKKNKQIFRGHEGATYIFETFVRNATQVIAKEFKIQKGRYPNPEYRIWCDIIKEIASEMVNQNDDRIPEDKLNEIIKNAYPQVNVGKFSQMLENNMLIVKLPKYEKGKRIDDFDFRFPFQKFSDHLIGRYLFKKFEDEFGKQNKNFETAKKFFSKRRKLGKFLSKTWNRGIIEALSIQCPEQLKGIEFIEVAPYLMKEDHLAQVAEEAFVESLIWRNPKAFSQNRENTLKIINQYVIRRESGHQQLINALLSVAPIPNHPFNAEFLHQHLSKFTLPKRDSWWSTFLHYQHDAHGPVDRFLQWSWSEQDTAHLSDDSVFLTSITLSWFLTTPNRFVRDRATKGLVSILQHRIHLLPKLLDSFIKINDPYITERLFAVAYGCVLRNQEDEINLKVLAEWIYENIFKDNKPPLHILLRDYARGVIEVALNREIKLKVNTKNINPPYKSNWPKKIPIDEEIKAYQFDYKAKDFKDYYWAQTSIINSMQTEYSKIGMYGDYGRYEFQSAMSHWDIEKKGYTMQQISNLAVQEIFKLGYDVELHGKFDRALERYYDTGRSGHKSERIGKKYQWIAFHKIAALVSDNFDYKGDTWSDSDENYKGPWRPQIRDIDPSFVLQNDDHIKKTTSFSQCKSTHWHYDAWEKSKPDVEWIKTNNDLPNPKYLIHIVDDNKKEWLMLKGFVKWEEQTPPEQKKYDNATREIWHIIKSYIVKKKDVKMLHEWAKKQRFTRRHMPESSEFSEAFLGEYPNSTAFENLRGDYNLWTKSGNGSDDLPISIVVTDDLYLNKVSLDCSLSESVTVKLPCKWLVKEMDLRHTFTDGRFFDKQGNIIALPMDIFEENYPSALLIDKNSLIEFLDKNEYAIIWTISGEKQIIGGSHLRGNFVGRTEISGTYILDSKGKLYGESHCVFIK